MPGLTPDEQNRISRVIAGMSTPGYPVGDALSMQVMLALFMRVVTLRDFAAAQVNINQQLAARIQTLEREVLEVDSATIVGVSEVSILEQ